MFLMFVFTGLTGNVFGASTNDGSLPDNMSPEVKNLLNYIQGKSGCSLGEAKLVLIMLQDQLGDTEEKAFLMYMMCPNNKTNLNGLNPDFTYADYFNNNPRYKAIKYRLDGDMIRYGQMSHEDKIAYARHTGNDLTVVFDSLMNSDIDKVIWTFANSNIMYLGDTLDPYINDFSSADLNKAKSAGDKIKSVIDNTANNVSLAMINYDCLDGDGLIEHIEDIDINKTKQSLIDKRDNLVGTVYKLESANIMLKAFGSVLIAAGSLGLVFCILLSCIPGPQVAAAITGVITAIFMIALGTVLVGVGVPIGQIQSKCENVVNMLNAMINSCV